MPESADIVSLYVKSSHKDLQESRAMAGKPHM